VKSDNHLTIVDWEMSRRGTSATDVGQFAAEAFLLDRFRGNRGLRRDFLRSYIQERDGKGIKTAKTIETEWIQRVAIHWAVHIAFWPTRVEWTDQEGTRELVDIGIGVMKSALNEDWEALKTSPLFRDVDIRGILSRS
jgi:thiamine kinase-like enzyme